MKTPRQLVCLIFALITFSAALFAQAQSGSILKGVVTDPSGAPVPAASVALSGPGGFVKVTESDAEGRFTILGIPGGKYTVRVSSQGFSLFEQLNFDIGAGKQISIAAKLTIETSKQEITVTDTVAIDVDPASNVGALVLKAEDLQMLSDNPDDLQNELTALAGPSAGPNGAQLFIDGFSGGKLPPKASIREVRINSNPFSAEYDRIGFGRIEIFTKPGTDKFRGQIFYNAGNNVLNSRNTFSAVKPDTYQNMISGSLSGPINKKSSFSVDIDSRINDEANLINAITLDSNFQQRNFNQNIGNPTRYWNISPRVDYQLGAKHTLVGRYQYQRNTSDNSGITTFTLPELATDTAGHTNQVQLTHTWLASAKLINEDRFQFTNSRTEQTGNNLAPTIIVPQAFTGGSPTFSLNFGNEKRYEYSNITSYTAKGHLIKFGGRIRGVTQNDQNTNGYNGAFTFQSLGTYAITQQGLANGLSIAQIKALGGGPQQFSISAGNPLASVDQVDAGLFIQDDWRIKPNVSLNLGLRYETQTNINNKMNFAPRFGVAWGVGKPGAAGRGPKTVIRAGAGIFYDRFSDDLVLSANRLNGVLQRQYIVAFPDFYPAIPAISDLQQFARAGTTRVIDSDLSNPYLIQMNLGVERSLPKNITLSVNYNHTVGVHQLRSRNLNTPLLGTYDPANPAAAVYPFGAAAGNLYGYESTGRFVQDQLVTNVSARINTRITAFGFYMIGKARGNTDGPQNFPNNTYDLSTEWGRTSYDIRHRGLMGGSFRAPYGIGLSPFLSLQTGAPFNITTGRDTIYGDNQVNIHRPALASGPGPGIVFYDGVYLDPNVKIGQAVLPRNYGNGPGQFNMNLRVSRSWGFGGEPKGAAQDPMQMMMRGGPGGGGPGGGGGGGGMRGGGGMGGGGMRGGPPGMFGDGGAKKYNVTLSAQFQNIFNHVNYGQPIGTLTSPLFGTSNTTAGGFFGGGGQASNRRIQLSLRFSF